MHAQGSFDVTFHPQPPYDTSEGITLTRVRVDKRFRGALDATSVVEMIGARTSVEGSAGYVAMERISGTLDGKAGTFVLQHACTMTRGVQALSITVVPDSGTGQLRGLSGRMTIQVAQGKHFYELEYELLSE